MKSFLILINSFLKKFYDRIARNTLINSEDLSFYRIFTGFFFLLNLPSYSWIGSIPKSFYKPSPLLITSFLGSFPDPWFFATLDLLIVLLLIIFTLGIRTRITSMILFSVLIIANSFAYSLGKIDHLIFSSLIFLLMAVSNSGIKYALFPDKPTSFHRYTSAIFAICLAFAFLTAGYGKAFGWIDFDLTTSGINDWFYRIYFNGYSNRFLADHFFHTPAWITEILDYTAVIFEISGFIFLVWSRKTWFFYLFLATLFHLSNVLILNIPFTSHFIVYGLWLLAPIIRKYKILFLVLSPLLFFKGLSIILYLWLVMIFLSILSYKKAIYNFDKVNN